MIHSVRKCGYSDEAICFEFLTETSNAQMISADNSPL